MEKLEAVTSEKDEKQKIIDELRKMVMEADTSKRNRLRSGYVALHYDSSSTEIKQLRAELGKLRLENENLKSENIMLKRSESLNKLAKMKEQNLKPDIETKEDTPIFAKANTCTKQQYAIPGYTPVKSTSKRMDIERQIFQHQSAQKSFLRASADDIQNETDNEGKGRQPKPKLTDKDKLNSELEFKFSSCDVDVTSQKRSSSKERGSKRVTFVNEVVNSEKISKLPDAINVKQKDVKDTTVNEQSLPNGNVKGSILKPDTTKTSPTVGRKKPSHLRLKSATRRSVSLNSLSSSRDIVKMSSQLIQKSRNLRQSNH